MSKKAYKKDFIDLQNQYEQLKDSKSSLENENKTLKDENKTLKDKNETLKESNSNLENDNKTLTGNNTELEESNSNLKNDNKSLIDKNEELQNQLKIRKIEYLSKEFRDQKKEYYQEQNKKRKKYFFWGEEINIKKKTGLMKEQFNRIFWMFIIYFVLNALVFIFKIVELSSFYYYAMQLGYVTFIGFLIYEYQRNKNLYEEYKYKEVLCQTYLNAKNDEDERILEQFRENLLKFLLDTSVKTSRKEKDFSTELKKKSNVEELIKNNTN